VGARDHRTLAVEDCRDPRRRKLLAVQYLGQSIREVAHGQYVHDLAAAPHRNGNADQRPARDRPDEQVGYGRLAGLEDPLNLRGAMARQRLTQYPQGIEQLLAGSIADDDVVAGQLRQGLTCLRIEGGKVAARQVG
jgi:hypothetical protein